MDREKILEGIIEGYRKSIHRRYQYQNIKDNYEIPNSINEHTVDEIRTYWLEYIYPEYKKRTELNEAFKNLDNFIKQPRTLLRILWGASKLLITYGSHLPKILNSGLKAIQSFRVASSFENRFVDEVIKHNIKPPFDESKIKTLMNFLPPEDVEKFINISQTLFDTIQDRTIVEKTKEVIRYLILAMKKNEASFSPIQIRGIEVGLEMLEKGDEIFNKLPKEDQKTLVLVITKMEKDMLGYTI